MSGLHSRVGRSIVRVTAVAVLVTGASFAPSAAVVVAEASTPALTVTVHCSTNPERTTIRNNRSYSVTIKTVGSIYQPLAAEPFYVYKKLLPGRSVTFYTGYGASSSSSKTLTRRYIYANNVGSSEGARVVTTKGSRFIDRC